MRVSSRSLWDEHLDRLRGRRAFSLNRFNYDDTADTLLPRAVAYTAGFLDHFCRARLDVDLFEEPGGNPSIVRIKGTNASPDRMDAGTLQLYGDLPTGERVVAIGLDEGVATTAEPNAAIASGRFQLPADAERFVAVYTGTLGTEQRDAANDVPGTVIGKVLGGVRVEEIARGSESWQVRTPRGVFTLPLKSADFRTVTWGDGENFIVATSGNNTGTVVVYEAARAPNSIEFVLAGNPPMIALTERSRVVVPHATPPLVTTVDFSQTVNYKQRITMYRRHSVTVWHSTGPDPVSGQYVPEVRDITPPVFEVLHSVTKSYAATIPIVLDAQHHWDVGYPQPYAWRYTQISATGAGVPVGLAAVTLTRAPGESVTVPHYYRANGQKFPLQVSSIIEPAFPEEVTSFWAIVHLGTGQILASTVEPTVTVAWTLEREGSRWGDGNPDFCQFPFCAPVMYVDFLDEVIGGPFPSVSQGEGFVSVSRRSTFDGVRGEMGLTRGKTALAVQGSLNQSLRTALAPRGFTDFTVGAAKQRAAWNYDCSNPQGCSTQTPGDFAGVLVTTDVFGPVNPPVIFPNVVRARPAPAGERLVMLGDRATPSGFPTSHLLTWDPADGRVAFYVDLPTGINRLSDATNSGVIAIQNPRNTPGAVRGSYVVTFDDPAPPPFVATDLRFGFRLLEPTFVYNTGTLRFYQLKPTLAPTARPAKLATPSGSTSVADYHAIRVP